MKLTAGHSLFMVAAFLATAPSLRADISSWTAQTTGAPGLASDFSLGYRFTVTNVIQLTHLGRVDYDGGGLAVPALTRLYNWDTGAALADVSVPAGMVGRETNGALAVHYAALASAITLYPGSNYLVAVEVAAGDFGSDVAATMANAVQWVEGRATPVGTPAMPATASVASFTIDNSTNAKCYLGPSFKYVLLPLARSRSPSPKRARLFSVTAAIVRVSVYKAVGLAPRRAWRRGRSSCPAPPITACRAIGSWWLTP